MPSILLLFIHYYNGVLILEQAGLKESAVTLLNIIKDNPYQNPPRYEKLQGDFKGSYSRRINKQHRLIYDVLANDEGLKDENGKLYKGIVKVLRLWAHYE
jgi:Txe/YoeB family toxin of toxin-antitoxin system